MSDCLRRNKKLKRQYDKITREEKKKKKIERASEALYKSKRKEKQRELFRRVRTVIEELSSDDVATKTKRKSKVRAANHQRRETESLASK